jgi:hypothetical protein
MSTLENTHGDARRLETHSYGPGCDGPVLLPIFTMWMHMRMCGLSQRPGSLQNQSPLLQEYLEEEVYSKSHS